MRQSATCSRDTQRVLFNRSVHKSVHKGAARAIHAVFINGCTSCTTFVAWDEAMRMRDGSVTDRLLSHVLRGVVGVDRYVLAGQVAGPEAAGAVAESEVDVDGKFGLAQVAVRAALDKKPPPNARHPKKKKNQNYNK